MLGLEDKVVIVTGGNRGIGGAIVAHLEELGAKVAYNYRSEPGPVGSMPIQADVGDYAQMKAMVDKVESELGPIYGVVANAGITEDSMYHKMTPEQWNSVINVNLTGAFNVTHPAMPYMYSRKEGAIVFISSITGEAGNMGQANYAAAKAGMLGLAKTIALEGARNKVRANVVTPGFTASDMVKSIPDEVKEKIYKTIPLRRFAEVEEIAYSTSFLLSPTYAAYITGQILSVNGGRITR